MLAEMEAYAQQALKIDSLEREIVALNNIIEELNETSIQKEEIKGWFGTLDTSFVFLTDYGKKEAFIALGEKH